MAWVIDLKLIGVQVTLTRTGTALLLVAAMAAVLVGADSLILKPSAGLPPAVVTDYPVVDPHPGDGYPAPVLPQAIIPLGRTSISVPILMYHYIRDVPKLTDKLTYNLSVTPADFNQQMDWLASNGYHPVTFDDLRAYFSGKHPLPSKPVVITLDDGYRDLYTTAYPILRAHGFVAVAYIVTSFVGRDRYVTTDMIQEMDRGGVEIASHTIDHANLARMLLPSIAYEVVASKKWLEKLLGHPVVDFAYPSGKLDLAAENELRAAGYSTAVTEEESTYHTWATRYRWARIRVGGGEVISDFIKNLGPVEPYVVVTPTVA